MSPHELELMLFVNKNFLSPSIFDKFMKWALSATAEGYKFDAPTYSTLIKQMEYKFPNTEFNFPIVTYTGARFGCHYWEVSLTNGKCAAFLLYLPPVPEHPRKSVQPSY